MSADAAPAAVPGPDNPAGNAAAPTGLLSSAFAPVTPARAAFTLDPAAASTAGTAVEGVSSAAYHDTGDTNTAAEKTVAGGAARQEKSVVRAWLLAGAARWAKGGGANVKRLDVEKARAQARQVKEMRQVKVNRSDAPATKAPAGASGGGGAKGPASKDAGSKSLNSKSPRTAPGSPKNNHSPQRPKPSGTGTGAAGDVTRPKTGSDAAPQKSTGPAGATPKKPTAPPAPTGKGSSGGKDTSTGGKTGPAGPTGAAGKQSNGRNPAPTGGGTAAADKKPLLHRLTKPGPDSKKTSRTPDATGGRTAPDSKTTTAPRSGPVVDSKTPKTPHPKPAGGEKTGTRPGKDKPKTSAPTAGKDTGKPFTTRESRETGYRDGTRAARSAAHIKAYGHGVKDGWTDTSEAAAREKTRLDKAHADRKKQREQEKPVTATAADAQPGVQPIAVKEVTATHVHLGDGAAKSSMSRREVRSLKHFERRLREKAEAMEQMAERTKALKAHADSQAQRATQLLEGAKASKAGDRVAGALARLEEKARTQAQQADEIHKRALRTAEAARIVLANAETRYGGIYQAVVESPETTTAEMRFYQGDSNG